MTVQTPIDTPLHDVLEIVCCPYCMSRLTLSFSLPLGALHCSGCGHSYPLHSVGHGSLDIPWLMRDDALATLDQDIVVSRSDPDSARLDYRRHIARVERRERFLAPLVYHTADPYVASTMARDVSVEPTGRVQGRAPVLPCGTRERDLFDRFVRGLPSDRIVLDVGCGMGERSTWLARQGLRVVAVDTSRARLERAATTLAEGGERALFVCADPMELPFAAASVDGVWCDGAFASVRPDRRTVFFRQVNRVLRPGGLLFLGAVTASSRATLRRYLLQRYVYRWPVVYGDYIARPRHGRTGGWRYRAVTSAREARGLCREHGFKILALRRVDDYLLLLARKERGTDG